MPSLIEQVGTGVITGDKVRPDFESNPLYEDCCCRELFFTLCAWYVCT